MAQNMDKTRSEEEEKERLHFIRILNSFRYYKQHSLKRVTTEQLCYQTLSPEHRKMIPNFPEHLENVRLCIEHNYEIIKLIISNTEHMFENQEYTPETGNGKKSTVPNGFDMDKVKTTLKQFVRDWSKDGEQERNSCYKPVIDEIKHRFPKSKCDTSQVSILVPGAGLGRLAHDIARLGYKCQGNEWSLFMLFASHFILNKCQSKDSFTVYPWVHQWCNNRSKADQVEAVKFPDINPAEMPENADFSMAAGDFLEVYTEPDTWDCVASVFFIDTAHNIIAYIETIWKILKPGGYWINLGPLLYHFADMPNEMSIELSYEDVKEVILKTGFKIQKELPSVRCGYIQNTKSMLKYEYDCIFFVAQKPKSKS